jgi:serine/threonine-protein kinase
METLVRVMENEPPLPHRLNPAIPAELEMICLRCLEKKPKKRYATAGALADDLDRFLRGEAVEAQPPGLWHRLRSWSRRQPACAARVAGLAFCAVIAQARYQLAPHASLPVHLGVMSVLAVWLAGSMACQWMLGREQHAERGRWIWATMEVVFLTVLLRILDALISPLVASYAVLIAVAGLWLRERLVWVVTAASVFGYGLLVADAGQRRVPFSTPHWHLIFVVVLIVLGAVVALQVHRFQRLSRYYRR